MRQIIILVFVFINIILPSVSRSTTINSIPFNKYAYPYNNYRKNYYPVYNRLNNLEKYTFGKTYPYETDTHRLRRLERQAFGEEQYGNFEERYYNAKSGILNRPKQNYNKSLLQRFTSFMEGETTGYTPQITPKVTLIE